MLHKIIADSQKLSLDQLRNLASLLEDEIRTRQEALSATQELVEGKSAGSICYQLVKTRCGKKGCKCARGELHGPYWYACYREEGKSRRRYVGRTLPDSEALLKCSGRLRRKAENIRSNSDQKELKGRNALARARKALLH